MTDEEKLRQLIARLNHEDDLAQILEWAIEVAARDEPAGLLADELTDPEEAHSRGFLITHEGIIDTVGTHLTTLITYLLLETANDKEPTAQDNE